ncbi:AcvB/VirJ family lysyl-phosphatidylglycerol hydrolase [Nevskia sp.]|uniref:AcvB/VirJ family lysyl-phosphatidylglycerol hydrolase n=1 Tax=Nevskia sp. TaxID=1929292 RepID=UPI0025D31930|nr:AcvB/VirJ family lysyl-phosphatidylglycerol hydrolase [Nevskia sp.]
MKPLIHTLVLATAFGAIVSVPASAASKALKAAAAAPVVVPAAAVPSGPETLSHGIFKDVVIHRPEGTPKSFVLFLSGDGGWVSRDRGGPAAMVQALVADGAMVVAISTPQLISALEADGGECAYTVGDFENLSHFVQAWARLPTYLQPILAGHGAGATLAYGVLAQAEKGSFAGAVTTAFCPDLNLKKPFCAGNGARMAPRSADGGIEFLPTPKLTAPWLTLHGEIDQVCDLDSVSKFVAGSDQGSLVSLPKVGHGFTSPENWIAAYRKSINQLETAQGRSSVPLPPSDLGELPVIEVDADVPATGAAQHADTFAILISGDGGWAGIDKEVAGFIADAGMPVIGIDSLRYFWSERTPEAFAADLDKIIRYYRHSLNRPKVLLIGYSQGADVLPFALNRMSATSRSEIALVALLGLAEHAQFEFHLSSWVGSVDDGKPTRPEVARLQASSANPPILCAYGEEDEDSICATLGGPKMSVLKLSGGHHFDGEYEMLAGKLLAALPAGKAASGR